MQRFLRQAVTLSDKTRRIFPSYSLPKPLPPHTSASSLNPPLHPFHPWGSEHTVSGIFLGFHSGPVFARHFMFNSSNSVLRISSGRAGGFRPQLLRAQFHGKGSDVNRSFPYNNGGRRSWFKGLTAKDLVSGLITANVVVFLSWKIASENFMSENFTISLHNLNCGRMHTLITNAFSHIDVWHIIQNMMALYCFGTGIGRTLGPEYLLKLYLAGAVGGSVFYLAHQAHKALTSEGWRRVEVSKHQALGASGAVNAITLLYIFLFPRATIVLNFMMPVRAMFVGMFFIASDVQRTIKGDSHISGSAHLGGAAVAAIAWARIRRGRL
ncbi:RHOMBOID-like protein 12, mitochondrial [Neltuma alba]|uniref:RHOMBOID-like protein 12, mitochondrial n=1 Tax=Neltuma alba TaxID=207710 RepID=UPI0010A3DC08|nr:RHOMBOID-like protein 12, mitochondrial [Prosopis alba]XP_028763596.1 RHOMBOID-like protein 12, mitochondrial [Prosopis alba]